MTILAWTAILERTRAVLAERRRPLAELVRLIGLWRRRAAERRALLAMSERDLRDIGITRLDAQREAYKPLWRA